MGLVLKTQLGQIPHSRVVALAQFATLIKLKGGEPLNTFTKTQRHTRLPALTIMAERRTMLCQSRSTEPIIVTRQAAIGVEDEEELVDAWPHTSTPSVSTVHV